MHSSESSAVQKRSELANLTGMIKMSGHELEAGPRRKLRGEKIIMKKWICDDDSGENGNQMYDEESSMVEKSGSSLLGGG